MEEHGWKAEIMTSERLVRRTAAESCPCHQRPQSVAVAINSITAVRPTKRLNLQVVDERGLRQ